MTTFLSLLNSHHQKWDIDPTSENMAPLSEIFFSKILYF